VKDFYFWSGSVNIGAMFSAGSAMARVNKFPGLRMSAGGGPATPNRGAAECVPWNGKCLDPSRVANEGAVTGDVEQDVPPIAGAVDSTMPTQRFRSG
jgi:hypothetical protein